MPRVTRPLVAVPAPSPARPTTEPRADPAAATPSTDDAAARFGGHGTLSASDVPLPGASAAVVASHLAARGIARERSPSVRPGVFELYARYDVREPMGRPRERVLTWTAILDERLRGVDTPSALVERILEKDLRRQLFLLEGILKLYRKDHDALTPHRDEVKALEDAIGDVTGLRAQIAALKDASGVPPEAKAWLAEQLGDAEEALVVLVRERWFPDADGKVPAVKDLVGTLDKLYFGTARDDMSFLADELRDELKEIRDTRYDMADLQGDVGMHELRRDLRWFPIYVEALDGLVQLSAEQNPVERYRKLLDDDLSRSRFVKLPPPDLDKKTMTVSLSLYTAVMEQVLGLGALKDEREEIEGLAHALTGVGKAPTLQEAEALASQMLGRSPDADAKLTAQAEARYVDLTSSGLLQALREELKPYDR